MAGTPAPPGRYGAAARPVASPGRPAAGATDRRRETARISDISSRAGLLAPALSALARASAAKAANRVTGQQEACDLGTKALVARTGLDEAEQRQQLDMAQTGAARTMTLAVVSVPAQALALASLLTLEEARRVALAANSGLLGLALERKLAWVALYRALGGGWDRSAATPALPTGS